MRRLGFLLVTIGFLGGSLASVLSEDAVKWSWFVPAVVVAVAGVVLVRSSERQQARATHRLVSNMQAIEQSLRRVVENMARLNGQKQSINPYEVRHRIEELFADDLNTFVEARESIAHSHGLNAYADVMTLFAAGERYLNRVWSASADGYVDEINEYLDRASEQFAASLERVLSLQSSAGTQTG